MRQRHRSIAALLVTGLAGAGLLAQDAPPAPRAASLSGAAEETSRPELDGGPPAGEESASPESGSRASGSSEAGSPAAKSSEAKSSEAGSSKAGSSDGDDSGLFGGGWPFRALSGGSQSVDEEAPDGANGGAASGKPRDDEHVAPGSRTGQPGEGEADLGGVGRALSRFIPGAEGEGEDPEEEAQDATAAKVAETERLAAQSFHKGRIADAVRYINDLITLKPYEAQFHFALGLCYRKEGKYQEALKKYQDVLDLGGPKPLVALLKAEVYAHQHQSAGGMRGGNEDATGYRDKVYAMLKEAALGGRNIIADVQNLPVLSRYQEQTAFIRLALQLERFEIKGRRRHDPFTNPFPKKGREGGEGQEGVAEDRNRPLTPEEQAELLRDAHRLCDRIDFYVKLQDEDKAMGAYRKLKGMVQQRHKITVPRIENDFARIVQKLPEIEVKISGIRLRYYYNQGHKKLDDMRILFEDGEYARVEKIHADIAALAQEMKSANASYAPVASEILERSQQWVERARVRLEFESQKPEIQGIIISGAEKMTILDKRVVKQGESLKGFRVVNIESNRVTFRYKGEEIPMVFRRY